MKRIALIVSVFVGSLYMYSQSPVKSLYDDKKELQGAYYKDLYNDLNRFVGTWIFVNGNTSLTIVLQKKNMQFSNDGVLGYYEDVLIGEYQYIENGIEKINTLSNLSINHTNYYKYNIAGNIISKPISGVEENLCYNCGPNEIKVLLSFSDPERDILGYEPEMIFHHYIENGVEKLRLNFRTISGPATGLNGEENQFYEYNIPFGIYILVKQ